MFCKYCGVELPEGSIYCFKCGKDANGNRIKSTDHKYVESDIEFLSTKEVASILGCSIALTREIMKREDFPLIKVGKSFKVYAPALDEWARGHRV